MEPLASRPANRTAQGVLEISLECIESKLTLGGLLSLVAEGEVLARSSGRRRFLLKFPARAVAATGRSLIDHVLAGTSMGEWEIASTTASDNDFCDEAPVGRLPAHDTRRLTILAKSTGIPPTLTWSTDSITGASSLLSFDLSEAIAVHLRNDGVRPNAPSAADGQVWSLALARICRESGRPLILIGDEPRPMNFSLPKSLQHCDLRGAPLTYQLAIAANSMAFLGTASGMANAALFSPTPTIIFKSVNHHASHMEDEFGPIDRIAFWRPHQWMFRHDPGEDEIVEEFRGLQVGDT